MTKASRRWSFLTPRADLKEKMRHDNLVRWWVSVFALMVAFILWGGSLIESIGPLVAVFLAHTALQGLSWLAVKTDRISRASDLFFQSGDIFAITAAIHWTGGPSSAFVFLYAIPVVVHAYHKDVPAVSFNAALSVFLYGFLFATQFNHVLGQPLLEFVSRAFFIVVLAVVSGVSVTLLKKRENIMEKHLAKERIFSGINTRINDLASSASFTSLMEDIVRQTTASFNDPSIFCRIWRLSEDRKLLVPVGESPGSDRPFNPLDCTHCPSFRNRTIFHVDDALEGNPCGAEKVPYGSFVCVPIAIQGDIFGVLFAGAQNPHAFSPDDIRFLDSIARMLSSGMERVLKIEDLQSSFEIGSCAMATFLGSTKGMTETLSAMLDGVVKIIDVDRANLMLWEPELKVLQTRWVRGTPPPNSKRMTLKMGEGIAGIALKYGQPYWSANASEDAHYIKGGGPIQSILAMPLLTSDGKPLGVINALTQERSRYFTQRDIDFVGMFAKQAGLALENALLHEERWRQIDRLNELDRMKSEFLSLVSHELRGPSTAIQGFSEILEKGPHGKLTPKQKDLLNQIIEQSNIQMRMVDDLLDLASIERGQWRIDKASCSITRILKEEFEKATLFARAESIHMTLSAPPQAVTLQADAHRLHQVIWNVLHNSIKYTRPGGSITVEMTDENREVLLSVTDTGIGISPEAKEKIFGKFFREDSLEAQSTKGLGLGLTLAREIIEAHGGRIWVHSPGPGKGSTFTISIPKSGNAPSRQSINP